MNGNGNDTLKIIYDSLKAYVDDEIAKAQLGGSSVNLDDYALKTDLHNHSNKDNLDGITSDKITSWDNKSDFSGNYNDLSNRPTIPTKMSELDNDVEYAYQPNFTYKIVMISEGQSPSVSTTGVYPDLVITFYIPRGSSATTDGEAEKMYFGWIPFDQEAYDKQEAGQIVTTKTGFTTEDEIGANMTMEVIQYGIDNKSIAVLDAQTLGKTSTGAFNSEAKIVPAAAYLCVIYPKSKNYVVTIDNGIGDKVPFSDSLGLFPQNGTELVNPINGITYCQSGLYMTDSGELFLYVDEK